MHESTPAAASALTAGEREFAQRLRVDWNNNGRWDHPLTELSEYVATTLRDQTLTATAPEEVMLIEGHAAASLQVEVIGAYDGLSLAAHFAPYNGRSVFYTEGLTFGVNMIYDIAVATDAGWEWFPQFTGVVRDVTTDRETGTVTLDCLDNVEKLRSGVDIPPFALWRDNYLTDGYKRGGLVDSSSIIDLAARSGGFTMGPRDPWPRKDGWLWITRDQSDQEWGPVVSVPFHGSILPEVGTLDGDNSFHLTESWEVNQFAYRSEAYRPGPHGYLALNAVPPARADGWGYKKYWFDEWAEARGQANTVRGTWVLGCWLYWPGPGDGASTVIQVQVRKNLVELHVSAEGKPEARLRETKTGFHPWTNTPLQMTTPGWYYLQAFIMVNSFDTYGMWVRLNDESSGESRWHNQNAGDDNDPLSGLVTIRNLYAISDVHVCKVFATAGYDRYSYDRTPADTARVSWGRNRVTYTLRETDREAWDLAKEVSSAEYGVVFFDEHGRFVFWNYRDVRDRQSAPLRTFTLDDLESLSLRNTLDSVRNIWSVTTRTGQSYDAIAYDLGKDGVPFKEIGGELYPATFILPAGSGNVFYLQVPEHVISLYPFRLPYLAELHPWEQHIPISGNKSYTGDRYRGTGPNSEQKLITRQRARLYLHNGFSDPVGFVITSTGQPRFRIGGRIVVEDRERTWTVRDESSIATYGERVIELGNNFWLQDEWQTRGMLTDIVSRMGRPIPVTDTLTVPGDPRVQLGDTIQVQDVEGFGERMWLQVHGIRREYGSDGLTDTYTAEMVTAAGVGEWDSPTYGVWDQSLIWS